MLLQSLHCELQAPQAILDQSVPCMVQLLTVLANRHTVMTALYVKVLGSAFALLMTNSDKIVELFQDRQFVF